jgi:hypothetical protein
MAPTSIEAALRAAADMYVDRAESKGNASETPNDAHARALWRDARTPELRAHLTKLYPHLFAGVPDPKPQPWTPPVSPPDPANASRVSASRKQLKAAWPDEFSDGARCGYSQKYEGERERGGYPKGFHDWLLDRRNAWFAGYNYGRGKRQQGGASQ